MSVGNEFFVGDVLIEFGDIGIVYYLFVIVVIFDVFVLGCFQINVNFLLLGV